MGSSAFEPLVFGSGGSIFSMARVLDLTQLTVYWYVYWYVCVCVCVCMGMCLWASHFLGVITALGASR
jgi:hypothetical protein